MSSGEPLRDLARAAGIATTYHDQMDEERAASPETLRPILAAMGLAATTDDEAEDQLAELKAARDARHVPLWTVVEAGAPGKLPLANEARRWRLQLEDGTELSGVADESPPPLPVGYHTLAAGGDVAMVLAVPPTPPLPDRAWGLTLPLYGLRPPSRGGIGDYSDLARASEGLARQGAAFVGMNPVHAGFLEDANANSPYSPSHRRRLNVLHVAVAVAQDQAADGPLIDYAAARSSKLDALETAFRSFEKAGGDPRFEAWLRDQDDTLHTFAVHQVLSETFGPYWNEWPKDFHAPDSSAVATFAAGTLDRVRLHAFLQWQAETQLLDAAVSAREAGMTYGLYLDLAVGTHPHGAETWSEPEAFARGVSLGAPPDAFSADGQNWGLAPFNPRALALDGFRPLIDTLRTQLRYARLLRIDHILGFDRAFWVPPDAPGSYVRMPKAAMLAVARIEAHRAGAVIIGEDLGNVPQGLPEDLANAGLLGCRVAMFERDGDGAFRDPETWEPRALASFGTHDLPTYLGWRSARDIEWRQKVGDIDRRTARRACAAREADVAAFDLAAGGADTDAMHAHLARTSSALVAVQIEDVMGLVEQPNLPGTVDEHPNWRRRLPETPEALGRDQRVAHVAEIMKKGGR